MTGTCEWIRLWTGERICAEAGAYRVYHVDCARCGPGPCRGALLCVKHTAAEERGDDRLTIVRVEQVAT